MKEDYSVSSHTEKKIICLLHPNSDSFQGIDLGKSIDKHLFLHSLVFSFRIISSFCVNCK